MEAIGESIFCYIPRLADAVEDDAASFLKLATLSRTSFFQFLDRGTGCGDVGGSPFATSLYAMHCEGGDAAAFDAVLAQILTTIFEDEAGRALRRQRRGAVR